MLVRRLWQLSEAGAPALLLGRPAEGPDRALFERLLEQGVLRHAGQQTAWDTCAGCDCGRDDRPIRWLGGQPTAICIADRAHDLALSPDDLNTFKLVIAELVVATAAASGFATRPEEISPGIWRLGRTPDGRLLHLIPTRQALHRPGLLGSLRQTEPTQDLLVLGPFLDQRSRAELARQGIYSALLPDIAAATGTSHPLALDFSSMRAGIESRVRLQLLVAEKRARFEGKTTELPARHFALLQVLAQRLADGNPIVSTADISTMLFSPTTSDARPRGLIGELRASLRERLRAPSTLIETRSNLGYALALSAQEISIEP